MRSAQLCVCIIETVGCFLMLIRTLTDGQPRSGAIRRKGRHHWVSASFAPSVWETDGTHEVRGVGSNWFLPFFFFMYGANVAYPIICGLWIFVEISLLSLRLYSRGLLFWKLGLCISNGARVEILVLLTDPKRASDAFGLAGASAVFYGVSYPVMGKACSDIFQPSIQRIHNNSG